MNVVLDASISQPAKNLPSLRNWKVSRQEGKGNGNGEGESEMSFQRTPVATSHHNVLIPNPRQLHTPPSRPRGRPPGSGKKRRDERSEANNPSQPSPSRPGPSQPGPSQPIPSHLNPSQLTPSQLSSTPTSQPPGPRRRGRPPGSKNSGPRKPATKRPHTGAPSGAVGSSGLRNSVNSTDGFAVVIDSHLSTTPSNKKGPLESNKTNPIKRNGVVHRVYKCRWNDCPYELHNFQTLRKHVYKHREQYGEEGPFPCCWKGCGTINLSDEDKDENEDELIPLDFNIVSAWELHIDAKHLNILAWELGDGLASSGTSEPAYFLISFANPVSRCRSIRPFERQSWPPNESRGSNNRTVRPVCFDIVKRGDQKIPSGSRE